ncbi:hypothetical protein [Acinetobacter towneri]|uniref:hypothetical protein n=1 Tax=Acinetobacter towneri TaxID=202956 RepID=UPI00257630B4|nr:hypothetical protein [Acinetobacter towneri]MDM1720528.1 hypothetical protein [Acinetobacter towneri]
MAILDHSLPLQVKAPDMMGMLDQGSQIAQFYTQNKTDGELNRLYKEANGDLNKMMEIGKTSPMARFVMPQLQAQQAAQQKAALDQQKIEAEIGKTWSETGQNNATTQGKNLANAQTLLTAANQALYVATQSGDANAVKLALNNAKTAGLLDDATYNQYFATAEGLSTNPEGLKNFALNLQKAYAQNPEKYNFTTADNEADNAQSDKNSQRTYQASIYGTDTVAETADKNRAVQMQRLEFDQQQAEIKNGQGEIKEANGKLWIVYKDGTARPAVDANGTQLAASKANNPQAQAQNEEAMRIQRVDTILPEVEKLLPKATGSYAGAAVDFLGKGIGVSTEGAKATAQLKTLAGQLVALMPKMSGPQSDKDVQMYREMAGELADDTKPIATRLAALQSIKQLNDKYREINNRSGQLQQGQVPSSGAGGRPPLSSFFQ